MGPDGDLSKDTETGTEFDGKQGERSRNARKGDTLNPLDGTLDGETETMDKYSAKKGGRSKNLRPTTTVRQSGDIDRETETMNKYSEKYGERSEIHAPDDKLFSDGLDFEDGTEAGRYKTHSKYGQRSKNLRPGTTVKQSGDLDKDTETGVKYRGEAGERARKAQKGDTLNPLEGRLDGETETNDKFSAKYGRRASKSKPKTALHLPDGRMEVEDRTSNQDYLSMSLDARPKK